MSRATTESKSVVREAGMLERWHVARQNLGVLGAVVISGRYTRADGSILDKALLYAALEKVIHKHGALNVCVAGEATPTPAFVRLDRIDLDEVVTFVDGDLREVLEAEVAKGFDMTRPLWRILVVPDGTVNFSFHHVIGDGQSGIAFHRTLLAALNEMGETSPPHSAVVSTSAKVTLVPPIEQVANLHVSPFRLIREIIKMLVPASWTAAYWAWTGYPCPSERKLTANLRLLYHKPEAAHRILQVCRAHQTSLTALMHTLATLIISEYLAEDPSNTGRYTSISTSIPVSLRAFAKAPPGVMCNYVSTHFSFPTLIKRTPSTDRSWLREFPWDSTSELSKTLRKQQTHSAESLGMVKFIGDFEAYHMNKLGKKRDYTFEISNVGRFPGGAETPGGDTGSSAWTLDGVYFSQSNPSSGGAIHVNVAGDPAGGIGISVSWAEGAIDDTFGEAFFEAFKEGLEEVVHHDIA
ncbi:alcohol acetyltransferase [Fomitopsis serialis]|uniref:alcohol acetyltransferase n=1 Tax=Fomitopsis serialis TaxID=139415 RepID=UPI0020080519|nr:alcohol acetyltransferase [Neoantrodia serialis]KAH9928685.1 alcohol acetyltransferase [Neoantrodia serialis]